ncbi:MAG: anti-sigma factor [Candidatus Rokubacteria bacterium]|nr:anti-sigma factor [Candidatus Rokubacteria bacterium]
MNCQELRACLGAHLDGELELSLSLAADEHLAFCMACQWAYARERELRTLLRTRVPREGAPAALRERIQGALRRAEGAERRGAARRWAYWAVPAAALVVLALGLGVWQRSAPPPVVAELVAKHVMYSRLDAPAEIVSASQETVAGWFKGRVRFDVAVPDFSPSGIRLVGGRLAELSDRQVAYLLYEKGRNLISLFAFPSQGLALTSGGWARVGDGRFYVAKVNGAEVVVWNQGPLAYALVSSLDREALLECADTVWRLVGSRPLPGA